MFPSLNPVAYIALGSIVLNVGLLGYSFTVKTQLRAAEGQFRAFVAESDAKANAQIAQNTKEVAKRDKITTELTKENEKLQSDLTARYAQYRRMLNDKTNRGRMPVISPASKSGACGQDEAIVAGSMDAIESRILEILEQGDKAINASIVYEDWLERQRELD